MSLWKAGTREQRLHDYIPPDLRKPYQRDRDRILYSSAFRRLAGVTQIIRAGEAEVFHTRQQHSLKVAQIGRRLAERCLNEQPTHSAHLGIDPDAVEAACLAHDLGHPPFGHAGEHLLNDLMTKKGDKNGFEGNAQSFRILVSLSLRFDPGPGLDLTRASLAACLKYPWLRDESEQRAHKWGAYEMEARAFAFARECFTHDTKTAEAEIMDWADDVAYSVHDLEDLHRCGLIPWNRINDDQQTRHELVARAVAKWFGAPINAHDLLAEALDRFLSTYFVGYLLDQEYDGSREHRIAIRQLTSVLISSFGGALRLKGLHEVVKTQPLVSIDEKSEHTVRILKQITRDYLIDHPSLAAQQEGQKRIIEDLFQLIYRDGENSPPRYLPKRLHYLWHSDIYAGPARAAADGIGSLTEAECIGLHNRLHGTFSGSVLDPIVR